MVEVEFYGLARRRAGVAGTAVAAGTVRAALAEVARAFPALNDLAGKHFLVSINGERFVADGDEPIPDGSRLLIFSADAGG
jgi:molybdopterin converting factor small subunit